MMISLLILTPVLGGCASRMATREPVTRELPGPPASLKPQPVPPATKGKSVYVVSEQRKQVIVRQNRIIEGAAQAWTAMQQTYRRSFLKRSFFGQ